MKIRSMKLEDVDAVHDMGIRELGFRISDSKEATSFWSKDQLREWIAGGDDVLLVAEIDGKIVGFILSTLHKPTGKATWENQVVLPEYRSSGIGRALINEMKFKLKESGAKYIHFLIRKDNASFPFYEKIGFDKGSEFVWFGMHL